MEGLTPDDLSEPNNPLMLIPLFFNIKRVLKILISINPPIAPIRDTGNGNTKAAMNPIAMYKLIHFRAYSNKCLLLLEIVFFTYTTQQTLLKQKSTLQYLSFLLMHLSICIHITPMVQ